MAFGVFDLLGFALVLKMSILVARNSLTASQGLNPLILIGVYIGTHQIMAGAVTNVISITSVELLHGSIIK